MNEDRLGRHWGLEPKQPRERSALRTTITERIKLSHEQIRRMDYEEAVAATGVELKDVHSLDVRDGKLVGVHLKRPIYATKQRFVSSNYRKFTPPLYYPR